jgi:hypothetical protein
VELSSLLPTAFWNHYVLPMSAGSPPVLYAILALAAQHKAYSEYVPPQTTMPKPREFYPLSNYGKAIHALNCRLASESTVAQMVQETLITCLLFICLNILQGNDLGAMTHLNSGLQINTHLSKTLLDVSNNLESNHEPIYQLIETFRRLDLQAAFYLGSYQIRSITTEYRPRTNQLAHKDRIAVFQSVEEGRGNLTNLVLSASQFMRSTAEPLKYLEYKTLESTKESHLHAMRLQDIYIKKLHEWLNSFRATLSGLPPGREDIEKPQASKCFITYATTIISLSVCLAPDETAYDTHFPLFLDIVQNAENILSCGSESQPHTAGPHEKRGPLFDLEMSVIQPLYFTALKCRNPEARYRAIHLMRQTGKEGVWDGSVMAGIAGHVVTLEENQRCQSTIEGDMEVLEESRVCGVALNLMRPERKVWIECSSRRWITAGACSRAEKAETDSLAFAGQEQDVGYVWEFREATLRW